MGYEPSAASPGNDDRGSQRHAVFLAAFTMIVVVFLALVGQGRSPREAVAAAVALGLGGAEAARRMARRGGDEAGEGR